MNDISFVRFGRLAPGARFIAAALPVAANDVLIKRSDDVHLPANVCFTEIASVLCAGLTVYKALKMLECKPGDRVVISGVGGLGHLAVQYAKAMGLHVAAVDSDDAKLQLATRLGAEMVQEMQRALGGAHGVLVTAVSRSAFAQALGMLHQRGTMSIVGLPPGDFAPPILDMVLNAKTVGGSIVGTRKDLQAALRFAREGKVHTVCSGDRLDNVDAVFDRMRQETSTAAW